MQPTGNAVVPANHPPAVAPSSDEKTMAMLAHVLNIVAMGLAPLVIYLVKKESSKYVAFHALESLFLAIAAWVASMVLGALTCFGGILPWIALLVFEIMAAMKVNAGEAYEFPWIGKFAREQVYGK